MIASKEELFSLAELLSSFTDLKLSTIGTYAANDGKTFARWARGGSCTLPTSERILQWFSDNWPDDLTWPTEIPRPSQTKSKEAT